jgi:hypothetical protein
MINQSKTSIKKKPRRKYTPCWSVVRIESPHVLAVFEYLETAEVYAAKIQEEYNNRELPLTVQIQPADYCHF